VVNVLFLFVFLSLLCKIYFHFQDGESVLYLARKIHLSIVKALLTQRECSALQQGSYDVFVHWERFV
jgi:hypothetical protein